MKTKLKFRLKKSLFLNLLFFVNIFVFASFTKEDRIKVRTFKLKMMDKYIYHHADKELATIENSEKEDVIKSHNSSSSIFEKEVKKEEEGSSVLSSTERKNTNVDNVFEASEKQGVIGEFSDNESDNATDNFFTIHIPKIKEKNTKGYLIYDLLGLGSYHSVSRSINKNIAFGGEIIVPGSKWSVQKEEISLNSLKEGENSILFTSSTNGIKYKIKNVKIVFENKGNDNQNISSLLSGDQLYIKGNENSKAFGSVNINNKSIPTIKGEYETLIKLNEEDKVRGFVTIGGLNGIIKYKIPQNRSSFKVINEENFTPLTLTISKESEYKEIYGNTTINIEKNSTENGAQIKVLKLRKKDYPSVSKDIKNLTANSYAYRLETQSGELTKKVKFSFPYDEKKLGARSAKEIKAFYFDYESRKWKVDPTSVVDTEKKTITVENKGDGDYINGVISVPESSPLEAFAPTSISGLKAADPTAGLQIMGVPTATQKGDANANYPIRVPAGIGGLQPSLSIGYNSGGGNGWMGEGWNINGISSITVDSRWGVPAFDGAAETELYSFDGEMLVYPNGYLPHRHNDISETNTAITTDKQLRTEYADVVNGVKKFYLRKNHDFTLIERMGNSPGNYTWKVTSTDGTKRYYGGSPDSVLYGLAGISNWALRLVEDVHGNTMEYTYYNENVLTGQASVSGGIFFQIKKIAYGKTKEYTVNFNKETTISRKDININAKQGFKRVEPYLLKDIEVKYKTELIRTYKLEYENGEFFKTLLKKIYIIPNNPCSLTPASRGERDPIDDGSGGGGGTSGGIEPTCNEITDSYTFEYYDEVKDSQGNIRVFGPDTQIQLQNDKQAYSDFIRGLIRPSKINGNIASEKGLNFRIAAGLNFFYPSSDAYGHLMFGFPFGYSNAEAKNAQQLIDFNGDGIQDMIYRVPDEGLFLRTGILDVQGNLSFSSSKLISNYSGDFSFTETKTSNLGWDMGAIVYSHSQIGATTTGKTTAYLTDANSDGLMDIVNNGEVWFNKYNTSSETSEMTKHSEYTENMVVKAKAIQPAINPCSNVNKSTPLFGKATKPCEDEPDYPPVPITDVVKVWIAPKDGYVKFTDNVSIQDTFIGVSPQTIYYSVEILNPTPIGNTYSNGRLYLTGLHIGDPSQNIEISRYNDYYSQMQNIPPIDPNYNHGGINNSNRLFVKSGDKIYVRLHKNTEKNFEIISNPTVTYVDPNTGNDIVNTTELSQDQFHLNNGSYGFNFFLNNISAPIYLDAQGTAIINVPSIYFQHTTDDFTFRIVTEDPNTGVLTNLIPPQLYPQSDIGFTTNSSSLSLAVNASEPVYLRFIVESDSQTDFLYNHWNGGISVNYNASTSYNPNVGVSFFATAEYPSYAVTQFTEKVDIRSPQINPSLMSGSHDFGVQINKNITNFTNLGTGTFYYIVKKGNHVLAKRRIVVVDTTSNIIEQDMSTSQPISGISPITFYTGDLTQPDLITIQVYCRSGGDYALFNNYSQRFQGKPFNIYYDGTNVYGNTSATAVNTAMYNTKSTIYNNWGQFLYKPGTFSTYTYGSPIELSAFSAESSIQNTYPLCQGITNQADLASCILNTTSDPNAGNNTVSQSVSPMKPNVSLKTVSIIGGTKPRKEYRWVGMGPDQYSNGTAFKDDETVNYFTSPIPTLPVTVPTTYTAGQLSVDTTMKSINRIQKSSSRNTTDGLSYGMGSAGNSKTILTGIGSVETQTFSDMNGDGYPDMVYPESIQFTNSTGSLENIKLIASGDYPTRSDSYQKMNSLGFSYNAFSVTGRIGAQGDSGTSTQPDSGMPWSGGASISAGINDYYDSYDSGRTFWMDINGDGLPDRIKDGGSPSMMYALNLGQSLSGDSTYENLITYKSHPKGGMSVGLGGSLGSSANLGGLSSFGFGISASVGASSSSGSADVVYEDINGDGLIDILEIDNANNSTTVRYNLGSKFDAPVPLVKTSGSIDFTDETRSFNGSISFGGNYMFNIGPITLIPPVVLLVLWIKAGAGATANLGLNVSETRKAFKDMNGDGFTDLVVDTDNGFIVNYSLIGRTNKLKSITNTISKGKYLLDYQFERANYNNPHAKLIVNKISIVEPDVFSQNYTTEQGNKMETQYSFSNRKYDRREREDFGFETVVKKDMNGNTVERTSTDMYFNNSYLLNGLIRQSTVKNSSGATMSEVNYEYKLRKFKNNVSEIDFNSDLPFDYDTGGREGRKMAIALLDKKIKTKYENGGSLQTMEQFSYTSQGLVSKYQYISPSTSYNSSIKYQAVNNNIIGVPILIDVYEGTSQGQLLRQREAFNINVNTGDVGSYSVFDGSNASITDVEYNTAGNITKVTYPPNHNGDRYFLEYTYDDTETGKYVIKVTDVFGINSTAMYNPLFDVVIRKVDTGGNAMVFYYDGFGRTRSIMGPNEIASNSTVPTVKYNYWTDHAGIPNNDTSVKIYRASTSNFDPENASTNNTIMTDSYSDFLGRVVQVKKDIEVNTIEARTVSGRAIYDGLGRIIRQYHPKYESLGNQNLNSSSLAEPFTSSEYDNQDRVISSTDEDNNTKTTQYTIENDLLKVSEEFLTEKSESLSNAEGKIVQKNDYLYSQPLTTSFRYSTIGELLRVEDPEGIITEYAYDLAGRRIQQIHPDKGTTSYEYDTAGNLRRMTTDNLLNDPNITNHFIQYKYDHNRLAAVELPDLPNGNPNPNTSWYTYGLAGTGNNSGKLIAKYDGTGNTRYMYGRMGEVLSEERTIMGYQIPTMYFKTYFNYDSWNRITKIKYPDNEIVSYHYDKGGNLKSVDNNYGEVYIQNINNDHYEQRVNILYGNGTAQYYSYNQQNRRLQGYNLAKSSQFLLSNRYQYDPFGNITNITNQAPVQPNGMGGAFMFDLNYDTLNRLIGTNSRIVEEVCIKPDSPREDCELVYLPVDQNVPSSYQLEMEYNNVGGIIRKRQHHEQNQQVVHENTYDNRYEYPSGNHKVAAVTDVATGNTENFDYDANGNVLNHMDYTGVRKIFWDEQDRMKAFYNDNTGVFQYNVYDDKGERTIKYGLITPADLYQNGELMEPDALKMLEYKLYPNPYITVSSTGQYTKHYFEGSKRFASRVMDGTDIFTQAPSTTKMAAQSETKETTDPKADFKTYLEKTGLGNDVSIELREKYQQTGLYYLHGDHLGTSTFVTNSMGDPTQFFLNLPFGETMLEQTDGTYNNPYKFNAKELDEDIGLYYYGARYYNPRLSIWYGVDPLAKKMPSWSPYSYSFDNPVRYTDPTGMIPQDPIYGINFWNKKLKLIGDDGKKDGKAYIVTGGVKNDVEKATKNGKFYTGDLSEGKNVAHIPTGNRMEAVVGAVEDTKKSGLENGGFAYKGDEKVTRSDQGWAPKQFTNDKGQIVTEAGMRIFSVGGKGGLPENASNLEMYFHVHPDVLVNILSPNQLGHSNPSDSDHNVQSLLEERGYKGNTFVVGPHTNTVTYFNGSRAIMTVNYDDWKKAGGAK